MKVEIVNVVATATIGESVRLDELADLPFITYNPSRYFCAYFKDESMEAKVSIFTSGKMIAVGAKNEQSAKRDLQHVIQVLSKLGIVKRSKPRVTVRNIVVTVELDTPVHLEELQDLIPGLVYEPEQFPGAIFRPVNSDATVLIFGSGKLVVAGIKSEASIDTDVQTVLRELNLE
jgi:transcription initiation factor TFIID TATA-box-binding protein